MENFTAAKEDTAVKTSMKNDGFLRISNLSSAFIVQKLAWLIVAAFLFCPVEGTAQPDPFVWYKAENNLVDSASGSIAVVQGGMQYLAGRVGQAFKFNGSNAVKFTESASGGLNFGSGNFTVTAWIKFTATGTPRVIYQNGYALNSSVMIQILADSRARFFIRDQNANVAAVTGMCPLNENVWHYVVGVRSGKAALLYVDGILQGSQTNINLGNINASCSFGWIGASRTFSVCAPTAGEQFFDGLIDEFKIVKRDLPGSEIMNIYLNP